jgi:hypothetical protein
MSFTQEEAIAKGGTPFRLKSNALAEEGVPPGAIGTVIYARLPDFNFRRQNVWEVLVRFATAQGYRDRLYDKETFEAELEEVEEVAAPLSRGRLEGRGNTRPTAGKRSRQVRRVLGR